MILHLKVRWADAIMDGPIPCGKVVEDSPGHWVLLLRVSPNRANHVRTDRHWRNKPLVPNKLV